MTSMKIQRGRVDTLNDMLTPPATPEKTALTDRHDVDEVEPLANISSTAQAESVPSKAIKVDRAKDRENTAQSDAVLFEVPEHALAYVHTYQIHGELGRGVWSVVYAAEATKAIQSSISEARIGHGKSNWPPSPPVTPSKTSQTGACKTALAVKSLYRRDGREVLECEARILTYLHSDRIADQHLVAFHGFDEGRCAIIMTSVPLSLEGFCESCASAPSIKQNIYDPVIGTMMWARLIIGLVDGLSYLQTKRCVHGDIKPANILLTMNDQGELQPLYCDFSSAHVLSTGAPKRLNEISAVTTDFTSPELLASLRPQSGNRAIATYASDVFALGVTLLFAATGQSPYADAQSTWQKLEMAKAGQPLDFAQSGSQGSRLHLNGIVDMAVRSAVQRSIERRSSITKWRESITEIVQDWLVHEETGRD